MATIDEQIRINNTKIDSNLSRISTLRESALAWMKDGQDDVCNQLLQSKRTACITEKNRKIAVAKSRLAEAAVIEAMNTQLYADNKALTAQRASEAEAMVELAKQGTTTAAVLTKATADAEATKTIADSTATAIETKSTTDSANDKTKTMAIVAVVVVVVLILVMIMYKKFKKAKK